MCANPPQKGIRKIVQLCVINAELMYALWIIWQKKYWYCFLHTSRELAVNLATRHDSGTRISQSATSTVYPKKYAHGFCFAVLCCGYTLTDFPISIRLLLHWHCGNLTIAPVPAKQPWWIWINTSCDFIMNDYITATKQSITKPCAYFLGYTVPVNCSDTITKRLRPFSVTDKMLYRKNLQSLALTRLHVEMLISLWKVMITVTRVMQFRDTCQIAEQ